MCKHLLKNLPYIVIPQSQSNYSAVFSQITGRVPETFPEIGGGFAYKLERIKDI